MNLNEDTAERIESLMVCFGFESAHQVLDVAMQRFQRNDLQGLNMLFTQLNNQAFAAAKPRIEEYNNSRDGKIDSAIRRLAVG